MTKVVYNACYGGFGLSEEAMLLYAELSGIKLYPLKDSWITFYFLEDPKGRTVDQMFKDEALYHDGDFERHDPTLVQIVEKLGDKASGESAKLRVTTISGRQYNIDEYDGYESVVEPDGYEWICV